MTQTGSTLTPTLPTIVLVTGPSGSGISKVAEVIHLSSRRSKGPFVKRAAAGLSPDDVSDALHAASGCLLYTSPSPRD